MRIVKATKPESMNVVIDTLFFGEITIPVAPAEAERDRVDIVFMNIYHSGSWWIEIAKGPSVDDPMNSSVWPLPEIPDGARPLAKLIIHRAQSSMWNGNIVEFE